MKLIIEIDEKRYEEIKQIADAQLELKNKTEAQIIANGIPYNPSGDCISRSKLREEMKKWFDEKCGEYAQVYSEIDNAPTVDTACPHCDSGYAQGYSDGYLKGKEERPKGEWIIIKSPLSNETIVKCNKCGEEFIGNDVEDYKFCPICGADMRKGGAE